MRPRSAARVAPSSALAGFAILVSACVATEPATGPRHDAIVEGADAFGHDAVVALRARRARCPQGHEVETFCTAVLIAPRVVLTAAHCLADREVDRIEVFFGQDVLFGGMHVGVVHALAHPTYDPATRTDDLALLALDGDSPVAPIALAAIDPSMLAPGTTLHVVGFGGTGPGGDTGTKREGTSALETVDDTSFRYGPGPALTCDGDSGGPVLIDDADGVPRLIGITRSGDRACVEHGIATRVDVYLASFVDAFVAAPPTARARSLPDVSTDFCAGECASDVECPSGMRCLFERTGSRCGYPEARVGVFGAECGSDAECGDGACVAVGEGRSQDCRCFEACPTESASGGCSVSRRGRREEDVSMLLLVAGLIGLRRRVRGR